METKTLLTEDEINNAVNALLLAGKPFGRYEGNDNSRVPKAKYLEKVVMMTDEQLSKECESTIWLSAYANNNPRSDYHWQCDCCYDECRRRNKEEIYSKAHKNVSNSVK